jgi:hypothetical protein
MKIGRTSRFVMYDTIFDVAHSGAICNVYVTIEQLTYRTSIFSYV